MIRLNGGTVSGKLSSHLIFPRIMDEDWCPNGSPDIYSCRCDRYGHSVPIWGSFCELSWIEGCCCWIFWVRVGSISFRRDVVDVSLIVNIKWYGVEGWRGGVGLVWKGQCRGESPVVGFV